MELVALVVFFVSFLLFSVLFSMRISSGQIINAYSFFVFEYAIKIMFSSVLVFFMTGLIEDYFLTVKVLLISIIYMTSIFIGFNYKYIPNKLLARSSFLFWRTRKGDFFKRNLGVMSFVFFLMYILLFWGLMVQSGVGTLWITDTRVAYQFHREGVGFYYVFSQFFLYLSFFLCMVTFKRFVFIKIIILLMFFLFLFYFFGSKRGMLTLILLAVVYYSYFIKKLSLLPLVICFIGLVVIFSVSQILYSNYGLERMFSYFEYFDNAVLFFSKYRDFDLLNGEVLLSNLWGVVPRVLYPEKPYFYGSAYLTELIYPGMAAKGHFIGVLPWIVYYLDFGVFGVALFGLLLGVALRYIQLLSSVNTLGFLIFFNFGVSAILRHVPFFVLFIIIILVMFLLRMNIFRNKRISV